MSGPLTHGLALVTLGKTIRNKVGAGTIQTMAGTGVGDKSPAAAKQCGKPCLAARHLANVSLNANALRLPATKEYHQYQYV
ncbi:MAG: hypothetical protein PHU14_12395 [Methylovulum sp.]|nr:hypothetical protein [Methylovulum sp.]